MTSSPRPYHPTDRTACLAVFDSNVPRFFSTAERAEFEAFLDDLPGPYLVIEDESGEVVACGGHAVTPGTTTADLCWGMVRQDLHGRHLGLALTTARIDAATSDPAVTDVALRTSQHTRGFYERLGFVVERVVPDGFAPDIDRCDMRLKVPRSVA